MIAGPAYHALMAEQCDILIVGGGLVGSSLAIALDTAGRRVMLAEARSAPPASAASYGERNLALARASVNGLSALGVWAHGAEKATPIRHIHVSRAGEFGAARIDADELGVEALGHTLPARELGAALQQRLSACTALHRQAPAKLTGLQASERGWRASLEQGADTVEVEAALVVGADGTESSVRSMLGINVERYDYEQSVFVATVSPERAMNGRAWERFSDDGPVAMLPLGEDRAGLVLTVPRAQAEMVAALDDDAFLALAQRRFGSRLGRLRKPGARHRHDVVRVAARSLIGRRAVLVGNAAQTVHPIGAQGFNLGLRDALTLAELVRDGDPGDPARLTEYAERRFADREAVMALSHGLVRLACLPQPLLAPLRSMGLLALDCVPPLRRRFARGGMGFRGQPPQQVLERRP